MEASYLLSVVPSALLFVAYLAGFGAALAQRRRLGKAAVPAAFGLGLLALGGLVNVLWTFVTFNLPRLMSSLDMPYSRLAVLFGIVGLITGLLHLAAHPRRPARLRLPLLQLIMN